MQEGNSYEVSESSKASNETHFQLKKSGVESTCVSVTVDFSPLKHENNQKISDQMSAPLLIRSTPIYNRDSNYFTPSFILESDKEKYQQNKLIYKQLFEQKVQEVDIESDEMYLPRPSKNNSFCCVCKMIFDDYLTHVNLPIHKAFMEKSEFYAEIKSLCGKFSSLEERSNKKKTTKREPKTKTVKKESKPTKPKSTKRPKKVAIDSISTSRGHSSNEEIMEGVNC